MSHRQKVQVKQKTSLNYIVLNAGWYPSYDIRVSGNDAPASIFYKANAWQNTGSTGKVLSLVSQVHHPSSSGVVPVLNPWFINFYVANTIRIRGAGSINAPSAKKMMMVEESHKEMAAFDDVMAEAPPVTFTETGTNFSFNLAISRTSF
ncbi:MAG: DUF4139 domain-containing protein [Bacteroidales bacterium]